MKSEFRDFIIDTATNAGRILMKYHGQIQKVTYKIKTDFKTQADDASDSFIRDRLHHRFPDYNIFSEEEKDFTTISPYSWVIDPLDGTFPFTFGTSDHFSVCISLVKDKTPVIGVIYAPLRKELYVAEQGEGVTCNGDKINCQNPSSLNKAMIAMDYGKLDRQALDIYHQKLLAPNGSLTPVTFNCASVPLCMVASGKIHAYLSHNLEPWDMAAAVVINKEAGAEVTTLDGKLWELGSSSILAAHPILHNKLLDFFKS